MANHPQHGSGHGNHDDGHSHHHIMPNSVAVSVGAALLFLTFVTVWIAGIDLGRINFLVAFAVATLKALLVMLFFMNLLYDRRENSVIFGASFLFLAIFIVLTGTDFFFRGDVYVPKGALEAAASAGGSKFSKPWVQTSELVGHGREVFRQQCALCHGQDGKGDGPGGAALNPKPRNFTLSEGWKNGRKVSQIFKTLREGLGGMPSFATLPSDDRWAVSHYVQTMGEKLPADTTEDLAKIGIDPSKDGAMEQKAPEIPVEFAIDRLSR
jgi:caa(3)-type oxidase subunit IV